MSSIGFRVQKYIKFANEPKEKETKIQYRMCFVAFLTFFGAFGWIRPISILQGSPSRAGNPSAPEISGNVRTNMQSAWRVPISIPSVFLGQLSRAPTSS